MFKFAIGFVSLATSIIFNLQLLLHHNIHMHAGGGVAEAFTNAFVQVKVLEIQSQLNRCMNCTCGVEGPVCNLLPDANFSFCMRILGTLKIHARVHACT